MEKEIQENLEDKLLKEKVSKIFGTGELTNDTELMPGDPGWMDAIMKRKENRYRIDPELFYNIGNREYLRERVQKRKEREIQRYGREVSVNQPMYDPSLASRTGIRAAFDVGKRGYLKTIRDVKYETTNDRDIMYNQDLSDELKQTLYENKKAKRTQLFTSVHAIDINQSIKTLKDHPELLSHQETVRFLNWLKLPENGYDLSKMGPDEQKRLFQQFLQERRMRIDILMYQALRDADRAFLHKVDLRIDDFHPIDYYELHNDRSLRRNAMIMSVENGIKYMDIEDFGVVEWFFDRYGFNAVDGNWFKPGAHDTVNDISMNTSMKAFKKITGYDFLDVYSYFLSKWKDGIKADDERVIDVRDHVEPEMLEEIELDVDEEILL